MQSNINAQSLKVEATLTYAQVERSLDDITSMVGDHIEAHRDYRR
ncbi:MAG: hypothetical protein AAFV98_17585 [Chloroflexota bacterium]